MVSALGPISCATAAAEAALLNQFDGIGMQQEALKLHGEQLAEATERSGQHEADRQKQRAEIEKLGVVQLMLSAVSATVGVGAAVASGVGPAYAAAMLGLSAVHLGHQCATQLGAYGKLAAAFGGSAKEIATRTQTLRSAMGYLTVGATVAGFCLSDMGQLRQGWRFLSEESVGGMQKSAAMVQAVLGIRESRARGLGYKSDQAQLDDRQEMHSHGTDLRTCRTQLQLLTSDLERTLKQVLHVIGIKKKIADSMGGL